MKKKVWSWIFTVFAIASIVVLSIFLVLYNKKKVDKQNPDAETPEISTPTNPSDSTDVYATTFSINLPETIQILVGTSVNLKSGYVDVSPTSMLEKLTYEITPKSSGVVNGIKLENNTIEAISAGGYTIKFKMPKSKLTYFSKTINVLVYEEQTSSHIQQIKNQIIVGESLNIFEMFEFDESKLVNVTADNKITYNNNIITGINVGESDVKFHFVEAYLEYVYDFEINVKPVPDYKIVLNNVNGNSININFSEKDYFQISYSILNRDEEFVSQDIMVMSSNEGILFVERIADPLIKIRAVSIGEATITISLVSDSTITVEIHVFIY